MGEYENETHSFRHAKSDCADSLSCVPSADIVHRDQIQSEPSQDSDIEMRWYTKRWQSICLYTSERLVSVSCRDKVAVIQILGSEPGIRRSGPGDQALRCIIA
jgi:hypothetical protein